MLDPQPHTIPIHLDSEARVCLGLTGKQVSKALGGGMLVIALFEQHWPLLLRFLLMALLSLVTLLGMFWRPARLPLEHWLVAYLYYSQRPRVRIWLKIPPAADKTAAHVWQEQQSVPVTWRRQVTTTRQRPGRSRPGEPESHEAVL